MWLLTDIGFFSIVRKPWDVDAGTLTVRARVKADLETLKVRHLPGATAIEEDPEADYRFRLRAGEGELGEAVARITRGINYDNFKARVGRRQGVRRHDIYFEVWFALRQLAGIESPGGRHD